jgi:hypothetical protein
MTLTQLDFVVQIVKREMRISSGQGIFMETGVRPLHGHTAKLNSTPLNRSIVASCARINEDDGHVTFHFGTATECLGRDDSTICFTVIIAWHVPSQARSPMAS